VIVRIVAPGVVSYPAIVLRVNVRRLRVSLLVVKFSMFILCRRRPPCWRGSGGFTARRSRTESRNMSVDNSALAASALVWRPTVAMLLGQQWQRNQKDAQY